MSHITVTSAPASVSRRPFMRIWAIWVSVPPVGTNACPFTSRNSAPSAAAAPQPPSLVALPPSPSTSRFAPRDSAWAINWPTP